MSSCGAPVIAKINGQQVATDLHCTHPRGHAGWHGSTISWPAEDHYGVVIDVTITSSTGGEL